MLPAIERILIEEKYDLVLVQGDTNTVLAGALEASKIHIPVGHVEAGLRSYDRSMPEEINRVLADHISTHLYAPTEESRKNLEKEGITEGIFITGNTVVDSALQNLEISRGRRTTFANMNLKEKGYILATAHRQENVDSKERLASMIFGFNLVSEEFELPLIFSAHPRTRKMLERFGIDTGKINIVEPIGYLDFLQLEKGARLILTDSGGVQEEGCILGTPCVTLRENTERPETIQVGANVLAGTDPERILDAARKMILYYGGWTNPYGDGHSAKRIVKLLFRFVNGLD
jgi:UDP-N-acetylglucosamine 2-epimerase (non-hydrolysing)